MKQVDPSGRNPFVVFAGTKIPVVIDHDGRPRVIMRMVIEHLGMNPWNQLKELNKRPWADLEEHKAHTKDDQYRAMTTASPETFARWVLGVTRVPDEAAPVLREWKAEIWASVYDKARASFRKVKAGR